MPEFFGLLSLTEPFHRAVNDAYYTALISAPSSFCRKKGTAVIREQLTASLSRGL